MQSRLASFIESVLNVLIGYGVAICSQIVIFPLFGIHIPLSDNLLIGFWFTLISIARSYGLRRAFNSYHNKKNKNENKFTARRLPRSAENDS